MPHTHIVKRREGHTETYDNHKVYASCYAACINTHISKLDAEKICAEVMGRIDQWIDGRESVTSQEIFEETTKVLAEHNKDAAFLYETHRDIS